MTHDQEIKLAVEKNCILVLLIGHVIYHDGDKANQLVEQFAQGVDTCPDMFLQQIKSIVNAGTHEQVDAAWRAICR